MKYHEAKRFIEEQDAIVKPYEQGVNRDVFLVQRAYEAGWRAATGNPEFMLLITKTEAR